MNMNVSLTDELATFVEAKVTAGRYASSSEVVQKALRLLKRVEQSNGETIASLRQAWQEGIDSGEADELDFDQLKAEARARLEALKA